MNYKSLTPIVQSISNRFIRRPYATVKTIISIPRMLKVNPELRLEIGSGPVKGKNGWLTMDLSHEADLCWDLRWPFPLPSNSVATIYSSHVFEHLAYPAIMRLLKECLRVMKRGAVFSICVPDASIYLRAYANPEAFDKERYLLYRPALYSSQPIDIVNYMAYMDGHHKHMFDRDSLVAMLTRAGFAQAQPRDFDPGLDHPGRRHESIYAIAVRP